MHEIIYNDAKENKELELEVEKILNICFKEENIDKLNLIITVTFCSPSYIKKINKEYRNIDKQTDVLSFPMFEKEEIENIILNSKGKDKKEVEDILGDIIINLEQVEIQAKEYNHSLKREFAYMLVHGFYHLMGYDHIQEDDKNKMRQKEEKILSSLKILR